MKTRSMMLLGGLVCALAGGMASEAQAFTVTANAVGARRIEGGNCAAGFDPVAYIKGEIKKGAKEIVVPKGQYKLDTDGVEYLRLEGLEGVTIDFGGSEFLGVVRTRMIRLHCCTNVTLKNLVIDYPYNLPFTQAVITEVDKDRNWNVKVVEGYPCEELEAGGGAESGGDGNSWCWPIQAYDAKTHELKNPMRFRNNVTVRKTGADTYRITGGQDRRGDVGDVCVFGVHERNRKTEVTSVRSTWCVGCRFVDIREYATPHGRAFDDWFCDGSEYHGCSIDRRPAGTDPVKRGMRRLRSGNHDAFMVRCAKKGPKIINCTAKYHCDDCVNITGMYCAVMKRNGRKLRIMPSKFGLDLAVGDTCRVATFDGGSREAVKIVSIGKEEASTQEERDKLDKHLWPGLAKAMLKAYEVEIDRDTEIEEGDLIISDNRCGNNYEVRGCDFGHSRARGIVAKGSHGIIADNRIEACNGNAILIRNAYCWIEGGLTHDVEVIGNKCVNNKYPAVLVGGLTGSGKLLPAGSHSNLRFIDNEFSGCDSCFEITGCKGLLFKGNKISTKSGTELSKFNLRNCEDVEKR